MNKLRFFMRMRRHLGLAVALFALLSMSGYALDLHFLYRPFTSGPATHPMTAICALLLGFATASAPIRGGRERLQTYAVMIVAGLCFLRFAPGETAQLLLHRLTPFNHVVDADRAAGLSNSMGVNTAFMFFLIAASILLHRWKFSAASQLAAFAALALPSTALTGYAYGLSHFYGQMSMVTVGFGLPLAFAAAGFSANRSMLRAILGPYVTGRIARVQIVLGYVFPVLCGFMVLKTARQSVEADMFGVFVIAISWFIILLISISSVVHEKIDHARRINERKMQRSATIDPLTGVFNRRYFDSCLDQEILRNQRDNRPLSVIMLDVDHFKAVNDTGGHGIGDMVLKATAEQLKRHKRQIDVLGRLGGEEFALLLPNTPMEGALFLAESLRRTVEELDFEPWPGHDGRITASFGCAVRSDACETASDFLRRADAALYRAKSEGRNRVVAA